jgi:uncharacterized protein (TIGR02646 family)
MRQIIKVIEPQSLTNFKVTFPTSKYEDLSGGNETIRIDIRNSCLREQNYLCAYCCDRITISDSHNEHIIPQSDVSGRNLTLDYNNIVASCQSNNHCGHKKKKQLISLTPLMPNCEVDIIYLLNGKMTHRNQNAQNTISVLNLRDRGLANKRKSVIDIVLFQYVEDLNNLALEDTEYLEMIIDEINIPSIDGKLEAFTPVIVNVLRQFLS